jgi:mono/diheme cytochrome c family protein
MKKIFSVVCVAGLAAGLCAQEKKEAGDAAKGKEMFEQCAVCHNVEGDEKKMGPSLAGLFKRDKLKNGQKVTDANVKKIINEGGNGMPAYADMLSDEEKAHVLAYLKTL